MSLQQRTDQNNRASNNTAIGEAMGMDWIDLEERTRGERAIDELLDNGRMDFGFFRGYYKTHKPLYEKLIQYAAKMGGEPIEKLRNRFQERLREWYGL